MKLCILGIGLACLFFVPRIAPAQLLPEEKDALRETLSLDNLTLDDLNWERKPFQDRYRLNWVNQALDNPVTFADAIMGLHASVRTTPLSRLMERASYILFGKDKPESPPPGNAGRNLPGLPAELNGPVSSIINWTAWANSEVADSTSGLTDAEKQLLVTSLPALATEEDSIKFDFAKGKAATLETVLPLLEKIDLNRLIDAGRRLELVIEKQLSALKAYKGSFNGPIKTSIDGLSVLIAGTGDDRHAGGEADLVIDFGGDNVYSGRFAAGILGASVLIDLGDQCRLGSGDASFGCGILGIGIARVVSGDAMMRGGSLTFGAGLAGVGVFVKEDGNDTYRSVALSQGFGEFGIGMCVDTGGSDYYDVRFTGQGAARTMGVGWLIDRLGNDTYHAGGLILNSPLFANVYYSNAQGYGSGYRLDTGGTSGGVGLLTDLRGDDNYLAETYAQAASYWFSIGSLYDADGLDTYSGYHYVQASAMHMTGAFLFDLAGDDSYTTKFGAAHALGHDYGVAFLLDRAGNDIYAARDSNPGSGNANGLGIFLDGGGDDRYQGPPGKGNPARGTGSLGLFCDMSGQDLYRAGLNDSEAALTAQWGIAYDRETPPGDPVAARRQRPKVVPGSQARPTDAELQAIYKRATQWGVGTAQDEVNENLDRLIAIGMPAFTWMIDTHLATATRLEQRAFVDVMSHIGPDARTLMSGQLLQREPPVLRVALQISIDGGLKEAGAALPGLLKIPALRLTVARAAGSIGDEGIVNDLLPLSAGEDRLLAIAATVSLSQLGFEAAYPTCEALIQSRQLPIRKAAMMLCAKFPLRALETGRVLGIDADPRRARLGVELLGLVGSDAALNEVGTRLLDPDSGVRIRALLALNGRCPAAHRQAFVSLLNDPVPSVRAVAKRCAVGR